MQRPRKTGLGDTGLPENAAIEGRDDGSEEPLLEPVEERLTWRPSEDFVIVFTSSHPDL